MSLTKEAIAEELAKHYVVIDSALGGGWDFYNARCSYCGTLDGRPSEFEHYAEVVCGLIKEQLIADRAAARLSANDSRAIAEWFDLLDRPTGE
ncbi:MAG: hypothetical protein ACTHJ9_14490 [Rhodanobacter sp.]